MITYLRLTVRNAACVLVLFGTTACLSAPAPAAGNDATAEDPPAPQECGQASWYGRQYAGKKTASGAVFDPKALTAAHQTLPFGTRVLVVNKANRKRVRVTITDRGPFAKERILDLSESAFAAIEHPRKGEANVCLYHQEQADE